MYLNSQRTVNGGTIQYAGSLDQKKIVLILGRNNFLKDEWLIQTLIDSLQSKDAVVIFYEHEGVTTAKQISDECEQLLSRHKKIVGGIQKWFGESRCSNDHLKKILKPILLLKFPKMWNYFLLAKLDSDKLVDFQINGLRPCIKSFGPEREIYIVSRSASGRAATLIEDEDAVKKIVCLGYPFKQPQHAEDPKRFHHLATLKKPLLIVQGIHDAYGGRDVLSRYALSAQIQMRFVDADHDFHVCSDEWNQVIMEMKAFMTNDCVENEKNRRGGESGVFFL